MMLQVYRWAWRSSSSSPTPVRSIACQVTRVKSSSVASSSFWLTGGPNRSAGHGACSLASVSGSSRITRTQACSSRSPIAVAYPTPPRCRASGPRTPITSISIWPVSATRRVRFSVARSDTRTSAAAPPSSEA
jgi:hypothetical protein